ncbi:AAA family ATPase [Ensifer sp. 4252]|uniref:ATP-binding protein n=1 Tax=Ensifer sp. 4252 TaxID=3373915 RepID=UPI003D21AB86
MRINRLDLARYGKFTDGVLDFGPRPSGSPDLHLVYGPNEAGKSTTFDAILDLVFSIGSTSRYSFLHPYATMRIGASINVGGADREFVRIKRPQNSLLDDMERPVPDEDIRVDLGGIDRDAFKTMFSLDNESLVKGGEAILASKGNLGELLFAASAGLSDLSRQLTSIRSDADGFYKYRAKSGVLGELKARLVELKQQRDALDLQASDYQRLVLDRDRLTRLYTDAIDARAGTQRRMDEIKRILNALPVMTRLATLRSRLGEIEIVRDPSAAWRREVPELRRQEIELRVKLQDASNSVRTVEDEISRIVVHAAALEASSQIDELSELRARYQTADKDIPKLAGRAAELSIESLLLQLGRPEEATPERLLLDAATVGTLRSLVGAKSGVDERLVAAQGELEKVERSLARESEGIDTELYASPDRRKAFDALQAIVKAAPKSDQDIALRSLARRRDAASAELAEALTALRPWKGTAEDLGSLPQPPSPRLEGWKTRYSLAEEQQRTSRSELDRLEPEARRLDAEIESLRQQTGSIDEAAAVAARSAREMAWAAHRNALNAATADSFVEAMRADDQVIAQRLIHFGEVGRLNQFLLRRASVGADILSQQKVQESAGTGHAAVLSEIRQSLGELTFGEGAAYDPWEFEDWFRRRDHALKARSELAAVDAEVADIRDHVEQAKRSFVTALGQVGLIFNSSADYNALVAAAEEALDTYHAAAHAAEHVQRLGEDIVERTRLLGQAHKAAEAWRLQWQSVCAGCWLHELGDVPDVGAVIEILSVLDQLGSAVTTREGLVDRVEKMKLDKVLFEAKMHELAERLGVSTDEAPLTLFQAIHDKIKAAGLHADRRNKLLLDLEEVQQKQHHMKVEQELLVARVAEMTEFFGVTSLGEVEACMDLAAQRRALEGSISEAELELVQIAGVKAMSEVEELTDGVDRAALEDELAKLAPVFEDQDVRYRDHFHALSKARDALDAIGGDEKVAALDEQRRTTLLEIEESARRYMELRAGVAAAEHGLKLYRDRHRSGMMARASEAFRTISRGAYDGVAAQPGKDGDVLIAVSAGGGSKAANELSDGTRSQLYLALRVAGYHEFVARRTPVPFIADDIMETFDDFRAEEAFRLFAEMGMRGQVIYFTHHKHLTHIAKKVCPNVRLHDLDEVGRTGGLQVAAAE